MITLSKLLASIQPKVLSPSSTSISHNDHSILGIPDVIDSYYKFRLLLEKSPELTEEEHPQLLICGHGAVDDPDASIIYDQVMQIIASEPYVKYSKDIVVMRLPPSDQCSFVTFDF